MLFRTVYGAELEAIFQMIKVYHSIPKKEIYRCFIAHKIEKPVLRNQNIDDAITFLISAYLITENGESLVAVQQDMPFVLQVLLNLRSLELGTRDPVHELDILYFHILTEIFFKPNRILVHDIHLEANSLRKVIEAGGLSKEKMRAWARVMEFLGIGRRTSGGFICLINPNLLRHVLNCWQQDEDSLQTFLEEHFNFFLPYESNTGDIAQSLLRSMLYLVDMNEVMLYKMQDSPRKAYFQPISYKGIRKVMAI